jgi:hypothetical protein
VLSVGREWIPSVCCQSTVPHIKDHFEGQLKPIKRLLTHEVPKHVRDCVLIVFIFHCMQVWFDNLKFTFQSKLDKHYWIHPVPKSLYVVAGATNFFKAPEVAR